jgi:hypothetical protein
MPGVPLDAMDTMKKAFKGLFKSKKPKKEESTPTATTSDAATPATAKPTETTPAAPAPATAPEAAKTETTPATTGSVPAAPSAAAAPAQVPVQGEAKQHEAAALTEVRKATQSRSTSSSNSNSQQYREGEAWGDDTRSRWTTSGERRVSARRRSQHALLRSRERRIQAYSGASVAAIEAIVLSALYALLSDYWRRRSPRSCSWLSLHRESMPYMAAHGYGAHDITPSRHGFSFLGSLHISYILPDHKLMILFSP